MALITCSECGKSVSDLAAACVHCGNPHLLSKAVGDSTPDTQTDEKRPWYSRRYNVGAGAGCLVIGIMVAIFIASLMSFDRDETVFARQTPTPDLSAKVDFTGAQFVITNSDSYDWTNCDFRINRRLPGGGYRANSVRIAARSSIAVGAMNFARSGGERFDPFRMRPNSFSIACDTPQGRRSYFGQW